MEIFGCNNLFLIQGCYKVDNTMDLQGFLQVSTIPGLWTGLDHGLTVFLALIN